MQQLVKYFVYISDANREGLSSDVECFAGLEGELVTRSTSLNDVVMGIEPNPDPGFPTLIGTLWLRDETRLIELSEPALPGVTYVSVCTTEDIEYQGGLSLSVAEDGSVVPSMVGYIDAKFAAYTPTITAAELTNSSSPYTISDGDALTVVTVDTSAGNISIALPSAAIIRTVLVENRAGGGNVEITSLAPELIGGASVLVLGPDERATLGSYGSAWGVW